MILYDKYILSIYFASEVKAHLERKWWLGQESRNLGQECIVNNLWLYLSLLKQISGELGFDEVSDLTSCERWPLSRLLWSQSMLGYSEDKQRKSLNSVSPHSVSSRLIVHSHFSLHRVSQYLRLGKIYIVLQCFCTSETVLLVFLFQMVCNRKGFTKHWIFYITLISLISVLI